MANPLGKQRISKNDGKQVTRRGDKQNNEHVNDGSNVKSDDIDRNAKLLLNAPWKIVLQNARGIITENSNEKLGILENYKNRCNYINEYY